ncbi:hypothetical protein GCM10027275_31750 [Rhabdobacter roseus]
MGAGLLPLRAQNCGCTRTISASGIYNNQQMQVQPGEVVCIQAGTYSLLRFLNFQGTASQPITFKNCGGAVTIAHNTYYSALDFQNSKYIRVTGTGSADPYGIRITATGGPASGVSVGALSTNVELDHLEVSGTGFAGIMVKTDPNCDSLTWRSNFVMNDVKVHHNYIHHTGGEGLYIGNTSYDGFTINCNGQSRVVYPHLIYGLKVYENRVDSTGADGIQVACTPDAEVYNNVVTNFGRDPFAQFQDNGIQVGGGAGGVCYSNLVINGPGNGFSMPGYQGGLRIINNVIASVGGMGIFADDRTVPAQGSTLLLAHNTIVTSGLESIRLYGTRTNKKVYNNLLVAPQNNAYIGHMSGATSDDQGNRKLSTVAAAQFVNSSTRDYHLTVNSPAVNAGINVSTWNITKDFDGNTRPLGGKYDAGAYESFLNPPVFSPVASQSVPNNSTSTFNIIATDPDGDSLTLTTYNVPSFVTFQTGDTIVVTAAPQGNVGNYTFSLVVTDPTGGKDSIAVQLQVYAVPPSTPTLMFRVNAGGPEISDTGMNWSADTQTTPSIYTNVAQAASVPGVTVVSTNTTGAPTAIFETFRRDSQGGGDMIWNFPVYQGTYWYEVNLFFNESVSGSQRLFHMSLEGSSIAQNFEIRAEAGLRNALKKTYLVQVSDGFLTLQFGRSLNDPMILGIEIKSLGSTPPNARMGAEVAYLPAATPAKEWICYPNPARDEITIEGPLADLSAGQAVEFVLRDLNGKTISRTSTTQASEKLPLTDITPGLYLLNIVTREGTVVKKIVKQ